MRLLINILSLWLFLVIAILASLPSLAVAEILGEEVSIDHKNFTLLNSRRVSRTVSEYTMRAVAHNTSVTELDNVKASLVSVPSNITIVDGNLNFGLIAGKSNVVSSNEFTIQINLRQAFSLADLVWKIEGDLPPPPPPPPGISTPTKVGMFMSIDDNAIKGEETSRSHKDWITVLAWSEGSSNSSTTHMGTGSGAGTINIQGVNITKWLDRSDPELRLAILSGRRFDEVKLDVIKSCGDRGIYTQYAITLNDVLVAALSSGGSSGEDRLTENVTFSMSSIETMYTPVGPDCRLEQPIYSFQSYD